MEKLSKSEKRIFSRGRSAGRTSEQKRSRGSAVTGVALELGSAWAGQKFAAGAKTPMLPSVPLHYAIGGAGLAYSLMGRSSNGKTAIASISAGLIAGQLGVAGAAAATPLFS